MPPRLRSMETFSSLPRRLTQLYSDTKTHCDAVVEQDTPEPLSEDHALHHQYRIQKDRLVAWGLDWSEDTHGGNKNGGDIDESLEAAGLADTVNSVLGTIKNILEEAERMQSHAGYGHGPKHGPEYGHQAGHASAHAASGGEKSQTKTTTPTHTSGTATPSDYASWTASNQARYEQLAKQLTESIDILYDVSRSRRVTTTTPSIKDFKVGTGATPGAPGHRGAYAAPAPSAKAKSMPSVPTVPENPRRGSSVPYLSCI